MPHIGIGRAPADTHSTSGNAKRPRSNGLPSFCKAHLPRGRDISIRTSVCDTVTHPGTPIRVAADQLDWRIFFTDVENLPQQCYRSSGEVDCPHPLSITPTDFLPGFQER